MADRAIADGKHPHIVFLGREPGIVPPRPAAGQKDLPSILLVHGLPADYSEDELSALDDTGRRLTEWYDANVGGLRSAANTAEFGKETDGRWLTTKSTWRQGRMYSPDLESGIDYMLEAYGVETFAAGPTA